MLNDLEELFSREIFHHTSVRESTHDEVGRSYLDWKLHAKAMENKCLLSAAYLIVKQDVDA